MKRLDQRGIYALVLVGDRRRQVSIGALGERTFEAGTFIYVGSAHGPGGLRARLAHHCGRSVRAHWHVDYLRRHLPVAGAWIAQAPRSLEHDWARALTNIPGAACPLPGFGSSGCACTAHLVHLSDRCAASTLRRALGAAGATPRYLGPRRLGAFVRRDLETPV